MSVYTPLGGAKQLFDRRDREVLICGPAGTGKSRACLEKINALCELHPGIRVLIVRQTRKSLSESVLAEFEGSVLPEGSPVLAGPDRQHRSKYSYPNNSEIILAGLDDPEKIMSTQFDVIYLAEATEASEHDWEMLLTRLRNNRLRDRRTGVPWHQAIADCNPGAPTHWLKLRCDRGQMTYIESRHADNPSCTPEYLEALSQLTGHRRARLFEGLWSAAEGQVYPDWDRNVHIVDRFQIPADWRRVRAIDFGFRDPFTCLWLAIDPSKRVYLYRQLYMSSRLVEDHAADILRLSRGENIETTVCDHDAEGRGTLEARGIPTQPANKAILVGIQTVQSYLRPGDDGKPRLYVLRDSLVEKDHVLASAKRPTCIEEEFEAYQWAPSKPGSVLKEAPLDRDNHALDALRYALAGLDQPGLTVRVISPGGDAGPTRAAAEARQWRDVWRSY